MARKSGKKEHGYYEEVHGSFVFVPGGSFPRSSFHNLVTQRIPGVDVLERKRESWFSSGKEKKVAPLTRSDLVGRMSRRLLPHSDVSLWSALRV